MLDQPFDLDGITLVYHILKGTGLDRNAHQGIARTTMGTSNVTSHQIRTKEIP